MVLPVELSDTVASIVEEAGKSVVRVEGGRGRPVSGLAISPTQVVSVAHGVEREEVMVGIDGAALKARVKGRDEGTDLVLLEVEGALTPARLDDGAGVRVGHFMLRLARPGETVRATCGIVSGLGSRPFRVASGAELERTMMTDAACQPGFSGGPLVTLRGEVVGLTSAALTPRGAVGIPTATVRRVVAELEQHGRMRRSHLGLKLKPVQLPEPVQRLTSEEVGLFVVDVEPEGPAARAGVVYGDTVLHLGDDSVRTLEDLYAYLRQDRSGQTVPMRLFRQNAVVKVDLTLAAR